MYLSNIKLWNFRKFGSGEDINFGKPDLNLDFTEGLNVLIGENDSGKTAIIDGIKLVLKTHSYEWIKIVDDDFYTNSQRFRIELRFENLSDEEAKNFTEWLGWEESKTGPVPFLRLIYDVSRNAERILPSEVKAGVDNEGTQLTAEAREYLKVTYLKPLRDAKSELIPKKDSRISQIFQSHEAFKGREHDHHLIDIFDDFNISIEQYFEAKKLLVDEEGNRFFEDLEDDKGKLLKDKIDEYIQAFYDKTKETKIGVVEGSLKNMYLCKRIFRETPGQGHSLW